MRIYTLMATRRKVRADGVISTAGSRHVVVFLVVGLCVASGLAVACSSHSAGVVGGNGSVVVRSPVTSTDTVLTSQPQATPTTTPNVPSPTSTTAPILPPPTATETSAPTPVIVQRVADAATPTVAAPTPTIAALRCPAGYVLATTTQCCPSGDFLVNGRCMSEQELEVFQEWGTSNGKRCFTYADLGESFAARLIGADPNSVAVCYPGVTSIPTDPMVPASP